MKNKRFMNKKIATVMAAALVVSTTFTAANVSADERTVLNSTFENNTDGWVNWGSCNISPAAWTKHNGNSSLYVGHRQSSRDGALYNLTGRIEPGKTYNVSTYWMSWQINNNENVRLIFSYEDNSGNRQYRTVGENTAPSGQWTNLKGTFEVPSNARAAAIYFETAQNNFDFYIDDVNVTEVSNGTQTPANPGQNPGQTPNNPGQNPGQTPGQNPGGSSSMQQIADAYMSKIKIDPLCPGNYSNKRPGVAYGSFVHKTYFSSTTKSQRGFNIMLPANYNPQKKYPVLYVLHGIFGDENSMLGNNISEIVGNHVADGDAKEMIVVLPNMYAATNGAAPSFTDEGVAGYNNFVNDLVNDLIPYMEKNYSVSTAREDRAIAGFSMGGRETLFIGITRPDLFGYVGAIAPAPGVTPGRDFAMNHPGQLQESELKIKDPNYTPYAIMICCGTNDSVVGNFPESYHNILTRNNQNHIWYTVPGADHDGKAIASGINNFVPAIFHANDK